MARRVFRHEQLLARAILLAETARSASALYDPKSEIEQLGKLDAAEILRVARRWLVPSRLTLRMTTGADAPRVGRQVASSGRLYPAP